MLSESDVTGYGEPSTMKARSSIFSCNQAEHQGGVEVGAESAEVTRVGTTRITTDKLRYYHVTVRTLVLKAEHMDNKRENNRAQN